MKKLILPLIVIAIVSLGYVLISKPPRMKGVTDDQAEYTLFWGEGCPHCKLVEEYINENKVESKVKIAYKEVYFNKTNQKLLEETFKKCPEIDTSRGMGVPLGFSKSDQKCQYGDQPIITWLKNRMLQ